MIKVDYIDDKGARRSEILEWKTSSIHTTVRDKSGVIVEEGAIEVSGADTKYPVSRVERVIVIRFSDEKQKK